MQTNVIHCYKYILYTHTHISVCKCNIEKMITNVNEHVEQLEVSSLLVACKLVVTLEAVRYFTVKLNVCRCVTQKFHF